MTSRAIFLSTLAVMAAQSTSAADAQDWHRSALRSSTPDEEILYLSITGSDQPDILERWWNGKRVRWLSESRTLKKGDLRGDTVNDVLQVDMNGDATYDGPEDMNVKWCDTNRDGIPDVQAFAINPKQTDPGQKAQIGHETWMVYINHDKRGVLGWVDWSKFAFNCWAHTGRCNWLPNYHGNNDFVKTHAAPFTMSDPRIGWENPFSFYDETGDGVPEMNLRWCAPEKAVNGRLNIPPKVALAYVTYDLDGNSGKDNETSYDLSLQASGASIDISAMVHPLPHFKGDPKFDPCFFHNEWRRLDSLTYMDRNKGYGTFFETRWKSVNFTFDEDGDDHRWERVEMLYPTTAERGDIYSTARSESKEGKQPGLCSGFQSDTLGDRGEFDLDGSGGAKLYIGPFDRKLHLYGAEWGAWTVDKKAQFHGGAGEPSNRPPAPKVEELVKYTDTDKDGFLDTVEFDYDGNRTIDLKVCLLDYKTSTDDPQKAEIIEPGKLGWKGMHELFNRMAQQSWEEALLVYRAAWKRDLTTPELDKLAAASSMMQRYQNAYWIKETVFRNVRKDVLARMAATPAKTQQLEAYLADYTRAYFTGHFQQVAQLLANEP